MEYVAALLPSAGLAVLFVLLMRSILHADRRERAAAKRARAERATPGRSTAERSEADGTS
ncbi:hypothetical protein [Kineococcus sp. SYSU DK002]|uniref:hypothetical protein n=1 Tax=Kineococcus sp. SYSU DK002 TaxID=3383123 RepID=UPI003D7E90A7